MIKKLISISKIEVLEDRRELISLDRVIELIFDNIKNIDKIKSSHYVKRDFEAIIFDFIKNEHSIYISLNSPYWGREIKGTNDIEKINNDLEIIKKSLEIYNQECTAFFINRKTSMFGYFLKKLSDKLIHYTKANPTLEDKQQVFENLLNEIKQENATGLNSFIKEIDNYRE